MEIPANTQRSDCCSEQNSDHEADIRLLTNFDMSLIDNVETLEESALKRLLIALQGSEHDLSAGHSSHSSTYSSSSW